MIVAVSLNAALDIAYTIYGFSIGSISTPSDIRKYPGGKGVNAARVYTRLGGRAIATGFIGGRVGDELLEGLDAENIARDFVPIGACTRLAIGIDDPSTGTHTDINEKGPIVTEPEQEAFKRHFHDLIVGADYVVMAGTLPPSVVDSYYYELIHIAREQGIPTLLDTHGRGLDHGVAAKPTILKMNLEEFAQIAGKTQDVADAIEEVRRMSENGQTIIITLGALGAIMGHEGQVWKVTTPSVRAVSALGCGDSFSGALIYALNSGSNYSEAIRFATAAGAANATVVGSGFIDRRMVDGLLDEVGVSLVSR